MAPLPPGTSLESELSAESAARLRDAETVTLEDLLGALDGGAGFGPIQQVVARTQLALYCATVRSAAGLSLTVCEYPSHEAAVRGETAANVVASKISGHTSRVHRKSVMHLVARSDAPDSELAKIYAAFESK